MSPGQRETHSNRRAEQFWVVEGSWVIEWDSFGWDQTIIAANVNVIFFSVISRKKMHEVWVGNKK